MDSVREESLAQFTSITNSSVSRAEQYLTITDWNLEQAIELYFTNDGADLGHSVPTATSSNAPPGLNPPPGIPVPTTSTPPVQQGQPRFQGRSSSDAIPVDDDEDPEEVVRRAEAAAAAAAGGNNSGVDIYEDDEAMAQRLQQELYADAGRDNSGDRWMNDVGEDGVRAPMARTTETLVGPDDDFLRRMLEERNRNRGGASRVGQSRGPVGIFNQRVADDPMAFGDNADTPSARRRRLAQATNGASTVSDRATRLAEMYSPPSDLITRCDLATARDMGKDRLRWIMVNIQDSAVFDSQVLNRDLWKDPAVKSTIKENFIFLQFARDSGDGEQYINMYLSGGFGVDFPHIGIIDPRTGELLKSWTRVPDKNEFLMQLMEFLERYSLDPTAKMPVQQKPKPAKVDFDRMTEDEMMQFALQQSMGGDGDKAGTDSEDDSDPDLLTKGVGKGKKAADEDLIDLDEEAAPSSSAPEPVSVFASIASNKPHSEPAANTPGVTRVQFRLPDGSRVVRRFLLSDQVERLFEYVKADLLPEQAKKAGDESMAEKEFDLKSLGKNLIDILDLSVEEAGLKMATVMVDIES